MSEKNIPPQPPSLEGKGEKQEDEQKPPVPPESETAPKRKRRRLVLVAVAALTLVAVGIAYFGFRPPKDDLGRFRGEWRVAVPIDKGDNQPVAKVKPVVIRVKGDRWTYVVNTNEKHYALTLRPEASPKEIDLVQLDRDGQPTTFVLRGIYMIEGDRAKIQTAPDPEPRPTEFNDLDGVLLERVD